MPIINSGTSCKCNKCDKNSKPVIFNKSTKPVDSVPGVKTTTTINTKTSHLLPKSNKKESTTTKTTATTETDKSKTNEIESNKDLIKRVKKIELTNNSIILNIILKGSEKQLQGQREGNKICLEINEKICQCLNTYGVYFHIDKEVQDNGYLITYYKEYSNKYYICVFYGNSCEGLFEHDWKIKDITLYKSQNIIKTNKMFHCSAIENVTIDEYFESEKVIDTSYMFSNMANLKEIKDLSYFKTKEVIYMNDMFSNSKLLRKLDL